MRYIDKNHVTKSPPPQVECANVLKGKGGYLAISRDVPQEIAEKLLFTEATKRGCEIRLPWLNDHPSPLDSYHIIRKRLTDVKDSRVLYRVRFLTLYIELSETSTDRERVK